MSSFRDADALRQMLLSRKGSEPAEAISLLDARKRQVAAIWPDEMSAEAQVLPWGDGERWFLRDGSVGVWFSYYKIDAIER